MAVGQISAAWVIIRPGKDQTPELKITITTITVATTIEPMPATGMAVSMRVGVHQRSGAVDPGHGCIFLKHSNQQNTQP